MLLDRDGFAGDHRFVNDAAAVKGHTVDGNFFSRPDTQAIAVAPQRFEGVMLWRDDGSILFKAEASAWTPSAVQLQQVWVDPEVRGRGYAQRGMRDLCRLLLQRVPIVCLFVRAENAPAIRVYEAIGMERTISYRSLIF